MNILEELWYYFFMYQKSGKNLLMATIKNNLLQQCYTIWVNEN